MPFQNILAKDLKKALEENPDAILLDVRTPEEVSQGNIPNSICIDVMDPACTEQIEQLDKSKIYYVYCASGGRSAQTCHYMSTNGFNQTYNLVGGFTAWKAIN